MASHIYFVHSTKLSICSWPTSCAWLGGSTVPCGSIPMVSRTRSWLSECIPEHYHQVSHRLYIFQESSLYTWLWCLVSYSLFPGSFSSWNYSMSLATAYPASIYRRRALGLSVKPTAPPSLWIAALFSPGDWSIVSSSSGRWCTQLGISGIFQDVSSADWLSLPERELALIFIGGRLRWCILIIRGRWCYIISI